MLDHIQRAITKLQGQIPQDVLQSVSRYAGEIDTRSKEFDQKMKQGIVENPDFMMGAGLVKKPLVRAATPLQRKAFKRLYTELQKINPLKSNTPTQASKGTKPPLYDVKAIETKYPNVKLDLYEKGNKISLSRIEVPKDLRNQGTGTQVMRDLIDYADSTGKRIEITPSADFGGSVPRLKEFYKRLGFIENTGKNKDFTISETMYRQPKNIAQGGLPTQASKGTKPPLYDIQKKASNFKTEQDFIKSLKDDYYVHGSRADFDRFDMGKFQSGEGMGGYGMGMSVGDDIDFVNKHYAGKYGEGTGQNLYLIPKKELNVITPEKAQTSSNVWKKVANVIKTDSKYKNVQGLQKMADNILDDISKGNTKDKFWADGYMVDLNWDGYGIYGDVMQKAGYDGVGDLTPRFTGYDKSIDVSQNTGVTLFKPERFDLIKTTRQELSNMFNQAKGNVAQGGLDALKKFDILKK